MPKDVKAGSSTQTPIDWMLTRFISERHTYENFSPVITKLADVIHSAPITNTWPERGASVLKRIKTKSRNRLRQKMLNAHLQVSINGQEPGTREALEVINKAKEMWVAAKPCRKLPKEVVSVLVRDQGVQANLIEDLDSEPERRVGEQAEEAIVEEHMQCEEQAPVNVDLHQLTEAESAFALPKDLDDSDYSGVDSD